MTLKHFIPCPHCGKHNHDHLDRCLFCYRDIPTRGQRRFQALVFWSSIAGILAAGYVAYQVGGG